jgi:hypothetical protein
MTRYIVMTAAAKVSGKARQYGRYMHAAVVETDLPENEIPKTISDRAKGVVRVVWDSGACSVGKTAISAFARAQAEASALASKLNAAGA